MLLDLTTGKKAPVHFISLLKMPWVNSLQLGESVAEEL